MRGGRLAFGTATACSALAACSLFTSLDGLQSSSADSGLGATDASASDAASSSDSAVDAASSDGGSEGGAGILSCDATDLVAYWPMDEAAGNTAHDCHQSLDGIFSDAINVTWGSRNGKSDVEFASNGYVTLGSPSALQLPGPFTVAGFYRSDSAPVNYSSLWWNFAGITGFEITGNGTSFYAQLGLGDAIVLATFPLPPSGVWEHLAAVFEPGARLEVYVNGVSVQKVTTMDDGGPMPNEPAAPNVTHEVRFGSNYSYSSWVGALDDVRIFSRALTPDEIKTLATN